ncbi:CheR family methyltransferase [Pseudooceanicola sp. C21-150M6]|uniref:CheR family methyltransferase n=1 Tax=Pseudooceanicola sp. C21-150M6 TaxID=3434355 RepID=UPI003D7FDF5E
MTEHQLARPVEMNITCFRKISDLAKSEAGLILPDSKKTMVQSRLRNRMNELNICDYEQYFEYVSGDAGASERKLMISALTTNVSHFFREQHHFDSFLKDVLPDLATRAKSGQPIRIWSAGCSSGQEPYSIAMTILSHAPEIASLDALILATDIDTKILEAAKSAKYSEQQISGIPEQYLNSFADKRTAGGYTMKEQVRRLVRFKELNLLREWPMKGKFDAIFCRNVVIYFDTQTQSKLWPRFHEALRPNGWLYLGHSERISDEHLKRFQTVGVTAYRKIQ